MQVADDGGRGAPSRRRGTKRPPDEENNKREEEHHLDLNRRGGYGAPPASQPHPNPHQTSPQHQNPHHQQHSAEGYPPSLARSIGRFYVNEPLPPSRAIGVDSSSSANSGPMVAPFGQEKYFMGGGDEYGRSHPTPHPLAAHNGHAMQQQQPPQPTQHSPLRHTSPSYGSYPPQAHPAQQQHQGPPTHHVYSHGALHSTGREGQQPLESIIEAAVPPAREKKGKGAALNSSGSRPTPKPQSPLILQWLQDNFENDPKSSVPRSLMYSHYHSFCSHASVKAVNAASFGKLIRSVFPDLKTRRLGTRGNSKYHYYGIRIKTTSPLKNAPVPPDCESPASFPSPSLSPSGAPAASNSASSSPAKKARLKVEVMSPTPTMTNEPPPPTAPTHLYPLHTAMVNSSSMIPLPNPHIETTRQLPEFPPLEPSQLSPGVRYEHAQAFMGMYRSHCQHLLNVMADHNFNEVEGAMLHFWQSLPVHMHPVISCQGVIDQIAEKDEIVYAAVVDALVPDVLASVSFSFTQALREFSRQLETYITRALEGQPPELSSRKTKVGRNFAGRLWREACMNYISCCARQVLMSPDQMALVLRDWEKVDFNFILTSISWVCGADESPHTIDLLTSVQEDFKRILQQRYSLEQFAEWIFHLATRFLLGTDMMQVMNCAQQLLLRWSYFHNFIMSDITTRKGPGLDAFRTLRMFMEEYLTYVLDRRLATLQLMRPVALPTYSALPQPEQALSSRYPTGDESSQRSEYRSSPLGSVDFLPADGLFLRPRSNPDLSGEKFRPSILGKMPPSMFTSITERPHKQRRLADNAAASGERPSTPPSSASSSLSSPLRGQPAATSSSSSSSSSSTSSSGPATLSPPSSSSSSATPSSPPLPSSSASAASPSASAASASSSSASLSRTPSLPPLDLLDALRADGVTSPKPSLPSSSLSSFSLGMGSFGGFGRDSFTSANGFIQTAGGYTFPKMSFSTERDREIPLPSASFLHKASFGSFSSFPEFSRASFDRLGSMDRGSVAWPQLFLNLSTAHTSYQSFSLPISDDKPGTLPPIVEEPPSPQSSPASSNSSSFALSCGGDTSAASSSFPASSSASSSSATAPASPSSSSTSTSSSRD